MTAAEAAIVYIRDGLNPVPIPYGRKGPEIGNWQHLSIGLDDVLNHFPGAPQNIGILLGDQYGTADLDLDCAEAIAAGNELAPETGMVFGRKSKPRSHYFYRSDPPVPSRRYVDPIDKKIILELRCQTSDGGIGLQTVVPPSVHESGEQIEFEPGSTRILADVDAQVLEEAVNRIAAAALLAKHWPKEGSRHEAFLALAGALARNGCSEDTAVQLHRAIYRANWGASADLNAADLEVRSTFDKCRKGENVTGIPKLKELIDPKVVNAVFEWLRIQSVFHVGWPEPILLTDNQVDSLPLDILPGTLGE